MTSRIQIVMEHHTRNLARVLPSANATLRDGLEQDRLEITFGRTPCPTPGRASILLAAHKLHPDAVKNAWASIRSAIGRSRVLASDGVRTTE